MWIAESVLFWMAKRLYRTQVAHSAEMKQALSDADQYNGYRQSQIDHVLAVAGRYGLDICEKVVLDLGCNDGTMTVGYAERGAREVVGVDIDDRAIQRAKDRCNRKGVSFAVGTTTTLPILDRSVDIILCYDVFEHVSQPAATLQECHRVLRQGGKMLIGTWGWYHPYAPHLWATMPVPWAHVVFSERTLLRTCRRVYNSPWYVPNMHDFDECGNRIEHKYEEDEIPVDYLNKLLIRDFERVFMASPFRCKVFSQPFGAKAARWTKVLLRVPWVKELVTSYIWVVLEKDA